MVPGEVRNRLHRQRSHLVCRFVITVGDAKLRVQGRQSPFPKNGGVMERGFLDPAISANDLPSPVDVNDVREKSGNSESD